MHGSCLRRWFVFALLATGSIGFAPMPALAQYTGNNQTNTIFSGGTSNWLATAGYVVGSNFVLDALIVRNGSTLSSSSGVISYQPSASNNVATVTGLGRWLNSGSLTVGYSGSGNSLVITNAGTVTSAAAYVGYNAGSNSNRVLVAGSGGFWDTGGSSLLYIGYSGAGNSLVISNTGTVSSGGGAVIGEYASSSNNIVVVNNGTWGLGSGLASLIIGDSGAGNSLVITNGVVNSQSSIVGNSSDSNSVLVTADGVSFWNIGELDLGHGGQSNRLVISGYGIVSSDPSRVGGSDADFTEGDNNSVLVTGPHAQWNAGTLYVGSQFGTGNSLVISNGGQVLSTSGFVGEGWGTNNVMVTSSASAWHNSGDLSVDIGSVVISDSGLVACGGNELIGYDFGNTLTIMGGTNTVGGALTIEGTASAPGSVWITGGQLSATNRATLVSSNGVGQLTVSNGSWLAGVVVAGYEAGSLGTVTIAGGTNTISSSLLLGKTACTATGIVTITGGTLYVTNAAHNATLEVRSGTLTLSGYRLLQVDRFVMTNACGHFAPTGGALIYSVAVLSSNRDDDGDGIPNGYEQAHGLDPLNPADANLDADGDGQSNLQEYLAGTDATNSASFFRITGVTPIGTNVLLTWSTAANKTNALQRVTGVFDTNNFATIFTATNTVAGTTNYLDVGAASATSTAHYYRVRLVP